MAIDNSKLLFLVLSYNRVPFIYILVFVGAIIVASDNIYFSRMHGYIEIIADL